MLKLFSLIFILAIPCVSSAKSFKNSFIKFNLPDNWECEVKGPTWNCSSKYEKKDKSAVIVFAAKKAGEHDSLDNYTQQISSKPGITLDGKKHFKIKKIKIQRTKVNGQDWVDGLSYNSEAPEFYTRYLATVKNKTAVIITFTSHQNFYTTTISDFISAVNSLEILNPEDSKITPKNVTKFKAEPQANNLEPIEISEDEYVETDNTSFLTIENIAIGIVAFLVLFFLARKK